MALDTVANLIGQCRTLLEDTVNAPYRYSDQSLVDAFNNSLLEIRRLRPDLLQDYFGEDIPSYAMNGVDLPTDDIPIDQMYRMSIVYYVCGQAQLRDDENTQDSRAAVFLNKFVSQLVDIKA